jgi:hypothetical protein
MMDTVPIQALSSQVWDGGFRLARFGEEAVTFKDEVLLSCVQVLANDTGIWPEYDVLLEKDIQEDFQDAILRSSLAIETLWK